MFVQGQREIFYGKRYEIDEMAGSGGIGTVYHAHRTAPRRPTEAAVKIHQQTYTKQIGRINQSIETVRERVRKLKRILAVYQHDGPIEIFNTENSEDYVTVSDWVGGTKLSDIISTLPQDLSAERLQFAMDIIALLADTLDTLEKLEVIHGDLTTDNIKVAGISQQQVAVRCDSSKLGVKLIDTDFTRVFGGHDLYDEPTIGKVRYLSPEYLSSQIAEARSEIFSLGMIFMELIGGNTNESNLYFDFINQAGLVHGKSQYSFVFNIAELDKIHDAAVEVIDTEVRKLPKDRKRALLTKARDMASGMLKFERTNRFSPKELASKARKRAA